MISPARSRLARFLDVVFVFPAAPRSTQPRWCWGLWPFAVLLGIPNWPVNGGWLRRLVLFLSRALQGPAMRLLLLAALALVWLRFLLVGGLPPVEGQQAVTGITASVSIERDALGIPTITAANRPDLAFGLGFVHGQDRFFQMDLSRRFAAGELSALIGKATVDTDKHNRLHRFRARAQRRLVDIPAADRQELAAYVRGVNAGLASLRGKPWEYHLLRADPEPWKDEDSVLIVYSMYLMLQGNTPSMETGEEIVDRTLPASVAALFLNQGDEWDAPLRGGAFATPRLPRADEFDLRQDADLLKNAPQERAWLHFLDKESPGSNNWAIAGKYTRHGSALVANDMHLGITVPIIWYRAGLSWTNEHGEKRQAWGATLPGGPGIIVGSNGSVAWGLTNTEGDWTDLVLLDIDPDTPDHYRTPQGSVPFTVAVETIDVKNSAPVERQVTETIWGPVLDEHAQERARPRALRWVAHDPEAVTFDFMHMIEARTVPEALARAQRCGTPHVNFVVGDSAGAVGWTVLGRLPRRVGFDGTLPVSWSDGGCDWKGYYEPEEAPRIEHPASGRVWTANNRILDGDGLRQMGMLGYDRGARAKQIRDALLQLDAPTEADMMAIQRDNRALFLERWQQLLLQVLSEKVVAGDSRREQLRAQVSGWGGRAVKESVGYRAVLEFRARVQRAILVPLTARCRLADDRFSITMFRNLEGPVWRIVQERPAHLLAPRFKTWDELFLDVVDRMIAAQEQAEDGATWGERNRAVHRHALSRGLEGVPYVGKWLTEQVDMPAIPLDGAWSDMPFIQGPVHGASQRMAVSPGHEAEGYFHMPGGQSGHFMSPHYRDGYAPWLQGERTPFLPGPTVARLVLEPR